MHALALSCVVAVVVLGGCGSINKVAIDEGGGRFHVLTTWSDPSALAASTKGSVMQWCDGDRGEPDQLGREGPLQLRNCVDEPGTLQVAHTPGYLIGLFSSAIWAGGMLGSAELVRSGLKDSGATTNVNVGASATSSASGGFVPPGQLKR